MRILTALLAVAFLAAPGYAVVSEGVVDDTNLSLVYDATTGEMLFEDYDGAVVATYFTDSAAGIFPADAPGVPVITEIDPTGFWGMPNGSLDGVSLGQIAPAGLTKSYLLSDLSFSYIRPGTAGTLSGDLIWVPEPASLSLLALGALAVARKRRSR